MILCHVHALLKIGAPERAPTEFDLTIKGNGTADNAKSGSCNEMLPFLGQCKGGKGKPQPVILRVNVRTGLYAFVRKCIVIPV